MTETRRGHGDLLKVKPIIRVENRLIFSSNFTKCSSTWCFKCSPLWSPMRNNPQSVACLRQKIPCWCRGLTVCLIWQRGKKNQDYLWIDSELTGRAAAADVHTGHRNYCLSEFFLILQRLRESVDDTVRLHDFVSKFCAQAFCLFKCFSRVYPSSFNCQNTLCFLFYSLYHLAPFIVEIVQTGSCCAQGLSFILQAVLRAAS